LGALLGDGCAYYWKNKEVYLVSIVGEEEFIEKYALRASLCLRKKINPYYNKGRYKKFGTHLWFSNTNHKKLFTLFKSVRNDLDSILTLMKEGNLKENSLQFIEGFFDAEGCVKIVKGKERKTPKICLDLCSTDYEYQELIKNLLKIHLDIEARYSIQKSFIGKDGSKRQKIYHLRVYKKDCIRKFFNNIKTTKLKPEKIMHVNNWLNNGK